ncbi:MAG TPA: hypothetical protein VF572_01415 [Candidatus Saccharimonadales bacterium]
MNRDPDHHMSSRSRRMFLFGIVAPALGVISLVSYEACQADELTDNSQGVVTQPYEPAVADKAVIEA